jgi:hypothetical protein
VENRGKFYNFVSGAVSPLRKIEHDKFEAVNQCIREAAQQAAATGGLAVPTIERFLHTSEETWDGAGSG